MLSFRIQGVLLGYHTPPSRALPTSAVLLTFMSDVAYLGWVGRIMLKTELRKKHKDAEAQKSICRSVSITSYFLCLHPPVGHRTFFQWVNRWHIYLGAEDSTRLCCLSVGGVPGSA